MFWDLNISFTQIILAFFILFGGGILQGSVGMGLGLFSIPLLILIDPRFIPGPFILAAFSVGPPMLYRDHKSIHFSDVQYALLGYLPGSILAGTLLNTISRSNLSVVLATLVLLALLISIFGRRVKLAASTSLAAGMLSGIMGTIAGMSGPPVALLLQDKKGPRLRGTLTAFFMLAGILTLPTLVWAGYIGFLELRLSLLVFAAPAIGVLISYRIAPILDRGYTRPAVLLTSFVSAILVIARQLI